jgi:hypothetical protein
MTKRTEIKNQEDDISLDPSGAGPSVLGKIASDGTLFPGSTGIASVVRNSNGNYTIFFTTPFASTNYKPFTATNEDLTARYTCTSNSQMNVNSGSDLEFTLAVFA